MLHLPAPRGIAHRLQERLHGGVRDSGGNRRIDHDRIVDHEVPLARRADDAVDLGVHELRATAEELRTSVELITRTIDRLQDPKALLLGPSSRQMGPGEEDRR